MDEVLVAAAAEEEYTTSLSWYAARNPEAADDFETEIGLALKAIAARPDGIRCATINTDSSC